MADDRTEPQYKLRLPEEMRDLLKAAAERNKRSLNAEILSRLATSLEGDQVVTNLSLDIAQAEKLASGFGKAVKIAEELGGGIKFHFTVENLGQAAISDEDYRREMVVKINKRSNQSDDPEGAN